MVGDADDPHVAVGLGRRLDDVLGSDLPIELTGIASAKLVS